MWKLALQVSWWFDEIPQVPAKESTAANLRSP